LLSRIDLDSCRSGLVFVREGDEPSLSHPVQPSIDLCSPYDTHLFNFQCFFLNCLSTDVFSVSIEEAEDQAARDILADYLAAELRQVNLEYDFLCFHCFRANLN